MNRKHGLLFFLSSCIPGCGQMHQGYMKRGMSLLMTFCGIFAVAIFLGAGALTVLMVPVWLYAFFDSYNLRTQLDQGAAPEDAFLFGLSDMDSKQMSALLQKRHSLVGWGLVILGVYLFYTTVVDWVTDFLGQFFDTWWIYNLLAYDVPRLAVTVGIIALGVWFIRGPKAAKVEDIPAFTPPEAETAQEEPAEGDAEEAETTAAEQEDSHGDE